MGEGWKVFVCIVLRNKCCIRANIKQAIIITYIFSYYKGVRDVFFSFKCLIDICSVRNCIRSIIICPRTILYICNDLKIERFRLPIVWYRRKDFNQWRSI